MSDGKGDDGVPYHLMPVAAVFGTYAVFASIRALYQIYRVATYDESKLTAEQRVKGKGPPKPLASRQFLFLLLSIVGAVLAYGYVCAEVNNRLAASEGIFDPYDILAIDPSSNSTVVKSAYRSLSKVHHPDKGGDQKTFQRINLAYKALSDETARRNWELHGHPDGPQTQTLSFAMPDWLLHPTGNVAAILVLMYLGMFVGLVVWVVRFLQSAEQTQKKKDFDHSVAGADAAYLASRLTPTSTHLDVLFLLASTPENITLTEQALAKADKLREEKTSLLKKKEEVHPSSSAQSMDDLLAGDGGWAEDDDDDEQTKAAAAAAKKAEEEKLRQKKALERATGKAESAESVKLEGIDDGVLGQQWVERTLEKIKMWPPPTLGALKDGTFKDETTGKLMGPLDHRAVRRNLCMTMGRLNAKILNAHPELVNASQKGLIDPTYFKSTMEYRQRAGLLLEAALRVAMTARSYRLAKTIIETVSMFKIGVMSVDDEKEVAWFTDTIKKQYGPDGFPELVFDEKKVETPDEDEIATGDTCALQLKIERKHAESFTKQKLEICQRQGIPPQVALQTYREGWWILVRTRRIGGGDASQDDGSDDAQKVNSPLLEMLDSGAKKRFDDEKDENKLTFAWPFIVSNVAQKDGKVKIPFKAPNVPGRYEFLVAVKSQEFLGADQEFTLEADVIDLKNCERDDGDEEEGSDDEEEEEESDEEEEEETKKEK